MRASRWWQRAVFYQVYPRSFADGDGDGIGDFAGMTARLDYLADLGIDAVWLSPHYPSPFDDCGYDITDFTAVAPEYGSLDDFRRFLDGAHARGIRVILDLVLNHSSDRHPWFEASRSGRDDPRRDWYVWRDGVNGGPPNDWVSIFGGSAWELDPRTGQYYYHAFLRQQPDLNWRNRDLKAAMLDAARFWLDLGVDGFRLDAVSMIFEDEALTPHGLPIDPEALLDVADLPPGGYERLMRFQTHRPGVHELMRELRTLVDAYPGDRVLVGEDEDVAYHGSGDDELHLVFNFALTRAGRPTPGLVRRNQARRLAELPDGAWPCNTLGNHDIRRTRSRWGDGVHDAELARLHLALLLTLRGTPFLYYGEEIGMTDLELADLAQIRDTAATRRYGRLAARPGTTPAEALASVLATTRDRERSPFQWSAAPNAGFCPPGVEPWLAVNPDFAAGVNAEDEARDPGSMLAFARALLRLRRSSPALVDGGYEALARPRDVLAFRRHDPASGQACLVALNFAAEARRLTAGPARVLVSSSGRPEGSALAGRVKLAPFEVLVAELR